MNGGQRIWRQALGLVLSLSLTGTTAAGRMVLDPGVVDHVVAGTDMMVSPGAWATLDMALGDYRIEVTSGEVSVVFTADRQAMAAGEIRLISAGTVFGLFNPGAGPATLRISVLTMDQPGGRKVAWWGVLACCCWQGAAEEQVA